MKEKLSNKILCLTLRTLVNVYASLSEARDSFLAHAMTLRDGKGEESEEEFCRANAKAIALTEAAIKVGAELVSHKDIMLRDSQFYSRIFSVDINGLIKGCKHNLKTKSRGYNLSKLDASTRLELEASQVRALLYQVSTTISNGIEASKVLKNDGSVDFVKLNEFHAIASKLDANLVRPEDQGAEHFRAAIAAIADAEIILSKVVISYGEPVLQYIVDKDRELEVLIDRCREHAEKVSAYSLIRDVETETKTNPVLN